MVKIWGRVDPAGKKVFKQLDDHQRSARKRGRKGLSKDVTKKKIDKIVKPAPMDKK